MAERDYVLGTHAAEVDRLGLQHRLWRPKMLAAWQRAGIRDGLTVLDVGAGPGYAALDLAEIVGPGGQVVALERSRRFLDTLAASANARGLSQLARRELDLVTDDFGVTGADAAWCRWVLSFVSEPRIVVAKIAAALRPGGVAVFHEYIDYRAWRFAPRIPIQERFLQQVMVSWREGGGEPDVGCDLAAYLVAAGFAIESTRLHTEIVGPGDALWQWPRTYIAVGAPRLVELGLLTTAEVSELIAAIEAVERQPQARMILPLVVEVIARLPA